MKLLLVIFVTVKMVVCEKDPSAKGLIQMKKTNQFLFDFDPINNFSDKWMSSENSALMKFVLDYVKKSNWESVVFFFSNSSEFSNGMFLSIFNCLSAEGKLVAVRTTSNPLLPKSLLHHRHVMGVVYFCDDPDEDFLIKVSEYDFFDPYRSWLIIRQEKGNSTKFREMFNGLNINLMTNLVEATVERREMPTTSSSTSQPSTTAVVPLVEYRKRQVENGYFRYKRDLAGDSNFIVHLVQIYKAAKTENETISASLGFWDVPNGMLKTKEPLASELRRNLGGYKISVGLRNSSQEIKTGNKFSLDSEADEESYFLELFDCLMVGVNASYDIVQFQKLGWRNEEGGWTHLLGGVVDGTVDFALETINQNVDKSHDMSFTYAIIITMNNIYFRRPKSGGFRDIFLAPFSPRLLLCVLSTSVLLAVAMVSITIVNYHMVESKKASTDLRIFTRGRKERSVVVTTKEDRKWEISEAALWSVSVLCMQGSQWSPKSISGSLLLINSLLFALIIYNSFAAFITSVLSVKDMKIKNLKDLAASDFAFGYTLGNSDELFLRTVNDTLLRELYFKGLRENEGVADPVKGMHRAAKGKYAFFVGARTARRALLTVVAHEYRCKFQELYLPVTKSYASIPVTRKSSLKKLLNYKIIKLMEVGLLHRFQRLILPSMPRCVEKTTFNSARLTDVYSAFFVLSVGWVTSLLIFGAELLWHRRKRVRPKIAVQGKFNHHNFKVGDNMFWLR